MLFIALTSIVIFLNFSNRNTDTVYNPPVFDGEKIKPGFLVKKLKIFLILSKKLNLEIDSIKKFEKLVKRNNSNIFLIGKCQRPLLSKNIIQSRFSN